MPTPLPPNRLARPHPLRCRRTMTAPLSSFRPPSRSPSRKRRIRSLFLLLLHPSLPNSPRAAASARSCPSGGAEWLRGPFAPWQARLLAHPDVMGYPPIQSLLLGSARGLLFRYCSPVPVLRLALHNPTHGDAGSPKASMNARALDTTILCTLTPAPHSIWHAHRTRPTPGLYCR